MRTGSNWNFLAPNYKQSINTFVAKPLKKPISQCQACFIDLIIIYLYYYLPIN